MQVLLFWKGYRSEVNEDRTQVDMSHGCMKGSGTRIRGFSVSLAETWVIDTIVVKVKDELIRWTGSDAYGESSYTEEVSLDVAVSDTEYMYIVFYAGHVLLMIHVV